MTPAGLTRLKLDEGCELAAYPDPESPLAKACAARGLKLVAYRQISGWAKMDGSPWTVGYGETGAGIGPDTVLTQSMADSQLITRVADTEEHLEVAAPWTAKLDPVRLDVLVNIAFNVGVDGLLHWPQTLGDFAAGRWSAAANDLLHEGKWNVQVGDRAKRLAAATESGAWA